MIYTVRGSRLAQVSGEPPEDALANHLQDRNHVVSEIDKDNHTVRVCGGARRYPIWTVIDAFGNETTVRVKS